ncbi:MAG: aminotransferase class I and II [Gemmatimonadota bacterium]|nr:aminotransferase class I and II [Gemmatimonadota bacterium]
MKTVTALRYVQPLREGGSLPAVVDTDDGLYVVKFRGAGQGPKALVAELIAGQLAQRLGLPVPELALVEINSSFGRSEADPEIQELLRASHGTNLGLRYLDGAFNFALPVGGPLLDEEFANRLVWLDAYVTNPDRTHRNPNLMIRDRTPWLIDHGAALYAHHDWSRVDRNRIRSSFPLIRDHILLGSATRIEETDAAMTALLTPAAITEIVNRIPDDLLIEPRAGDALGEGAQSDPAGARQRYTDYLTIRLEEPRAFVAEIVRARAAEAASPRTPRGVRR